MTTITLWYCNPVARVDALFSSIEQATAAMNANDYCTFVVADDVIVASTARDNDHMKTGRRWHVPRCKHCGEVL
jgi:hypothetical protein